MPKPYFPNDTWSKRAATEGYRARSVYKLEELDQRFHLLHPGMTVLDLGAAPGSWLQYASKRVEPKGKVIGIDVTAITPIAPNVSIHQADIMDEKAMEDILAKEKIERFDLVLSDAMANTSGIKDVDQWKSVELAQAVVHIAKKYLKPGGMCAVKIFRGADFDSFIHDVKQEWNNAKIVTVKASRDRSREVYLVMKHS